MVKIKPFMKKFDKNCVRFFWPTPPPPSPPDPDPIFGIPDPYLDPHKTYADTKHWVKVC